MKTENKYKSAEAERFVSASQALIEKGFARSYKDIAEKSGYSSQDFTDIKSGKKDLQRKFLAEVAKNFPINESFVLTGREPMLKSDFNRVETIEDYKLPVEQELELMKKLYALQSELMDEIKKERDRLRLLLEDKK